MTHAPSPRHRRIPLGILASLACALTLTPSLAEADLGLDGNTRLLMHFEEGSGAASLDEVSGNMLPFNGPSGDLSWAAGLSGDHAVHVASPAGHWPYIPAPAQAFSQTSITVEASIVIDTASAGSIVENHRHYALKIVSGKVKMMLYSSWLGAMWVTGQTTLTPGVPYQVAGVYDHEASTLCVYVDGVEDACIPKHNSYWITSATSTAVGNGYASGSLSSPFEGTIDELRVSDVAREILPPISPSCGDDACDLLGDAEDCPEECQIPGGGFEVEGGAVTFQFEDDGAALADVTLPLISGPAATITDRASGMSLSFAPQVAASVPAAVVGDAVVYPGAVPGGGDLSFRFTPEGVEDSVGFSAQPPAGAFTYDLDVSAAAGLRQRGDVLELLDAGGAPRLRAAAPGLVDADGRWYPLSLAVSGCAVDTGAALPWGAAPLPHGAVGGACQLTVSWDAGAPTYPVILDPLWSSTRSMAVPRTGAAGVDLADGRVAALGGEELVGLVRRASERVEVFDPPSHTWAAQPAMPTPRSGHTATRVGAGHVLVVGGRTYEISPPPVALTAVPVGYDPLATEGSAELASLGSGGWSWSAPFDLSSPRSGGHKAAALLDGRILITGGTVGGAGPVAPEVFLGADGACLADPGPECWDEVGAGWDDDRAGHALTLLASGEVMASGGGSALDPLATTTLFQPVSAGGDDGWHAGPPMPLGQTGHQALRLEGGDVVVFGGAQACPLGPGGEIPEDWPCLTDQVQRWDAASGWSLAAPLPRPRLAPSALALPGGRLLVIGGAEFPYGDIDPNPGTPEAEVLGARPDDPDAETFALYNPAEDAWTAWFAPEGVRAGGTCGDAGGGRFLLAGGLSSIAAHGPLPPPAGTVPLYRRDAGLVASCCGASPTGPCVEVCELDPSCCELGGWDGTCEALIPQVLCEEPEVLPPTRVAAGWLHSCALYPDSSVACWGENGPGQSQPPAEPFVEIAAGWTTSCGIRPEGTLSCWGSTIAGAPTGPADGPFHGITIGNQHACALDETDHPQCWGFDPLGPHQAPAGTLVTLSAGRSHTCGLTPGGQAVCWGYNDWGQASPPAGTFTQIASGEDHTCALATSGALVCWGSNQRPDIPSVYIGQATPPAGTWLQVTSGHAFSCALAPDHTATCWGHGGYQQLDTLPGVAFEAISSGGLHSCGVRLDGGISCWGYDNFGQATPP